MTFAEWFKKHELDIAEVCGVAAQRAGEKPPNQILEELFDISGVALQLKQEADEYHLIKVGEIVKTVDTGAAKTRLDYAKNVPCDELRVLRMLEAACKTIDLRTQQAQSLMKYLGGGGK